MRYIKLPQARLKLSRLLTTTHKFVSLDVTSRVDIDYNGSSFTVSDKIEILGYAL